MTKQEIKALKASLSIEEVIGRYIKLTRTGRCLTGLCPFHGDRHPSLSVNPEKGTFICYACGEKGDAIRFVQKMEGLSFSGTLNKLTVDSGQLTVEEKDSNGRNKNARPDKNTLSQVNTDAKQLSTVTCQLSTDLSTVTCQLSIFLNSLTPCGSGNSELTPAWLDFEVGQSPCRMEGKMKAMRNRLVFPIRDEEGELVGFAARRLSDDNPDVPKYINTSAADGYKKGETLYGLYRAKEAIRREGCVFVVEGYKDVLAMHAAGFCNTVALSGTALCEGQLMLLKKYAMPVYLMLDADRAGQRAAASILACLGREGMEALNLLLPEGEDADSLFRKAGKAGFISGINKMLQEAQPTGEGLLLRRIRKGIRLIAATAEPEERVRLLRLLGEVITTLGRLPETVSRPATMDWRWV